MYRIIVDNYLLIVIFIGFLISNLNDTQVDYNKKNRIKELIIVISTLTVTNAFKNYYDALNYYSFGTLFTYYICYIFRPASLILFISTLSKNKYVKLTSFLCIINNIIYSTCFFNGLAFSVSPTNEIIHGPLGYACHILCFGYLILFIYIAYKQYTRQNKTRTYMLAYIAVSCAIASVFDLTIDNVNLLDSVLLIDILVYNLYLYMEYNKIDVLTNTFNRSTFYHDIEKIRRDITSVISIDMNNLKTINDTQGHSEGDKAIVTISHILLSVDNKYVRIYRVGGDEFVALCFYKDKENVQGYIKQVKEELSKTKYSCSFGYAINENNEDIFELYKKADEQMYVEKEEYHKKYKIKR